MIRDRLTRHVTFSLAVLFCSGVSEAHGQEAVTPLAEPAVSLEIVERLRVQVEGDANLAEAVRTATLDACKRAADELARVVAFEEQAKTYATAAESAATDAVEVRAALEKLVDATPQIDRSADLPTLDQELTKQELQSASQRKKLSALETELQVRTQRRKAIHTRLAEIDALEAGEETPAAPAEASEHPAVSLARSYESAASMLSLQQEEMALRNELAKYDAEDAAELLRLRIDRATRRAAISDQTVQALKQRIEERREAQAKDLVRKARLEAIVAIPALKGYADENHTLAESAQQVAQDLGQAEKELKTSTEDYTQLEKQLHSTRRKVETVGLTSSVGALLRKQRVNLPGIAERVAAIAARRGLIDEMQYRLFEYDDARQELGDLDARVKDVVESLRDTAKVDEAILASAARDLLERKREYLESLRDGCNRYFETLVELDTKDRQVVELTESYAEYIDERVLWIRSGKSLHKDYWPEESDLAMASLPRWAHVGALLLSDARRRPTPYLFLAGVLILGVTRWRQLRGRLVAMGEEAEKATCRGFTPTLDALAVTTALASLGPLVAGIVAWRLMRLGDASAYAIGQGLASLAILWLAVNLARYACFSKGLGESHFEWSATTTQLVRRYAEWFSLLALPAVFTTVTLYTLDSSHGNDSIERVVFILGMLWTAAIAARLVSAKGLLRGYIAYHKGGWVDQLRVLWPVVAAAAPLTLAVLAYVGYYYTAGVLVERCFTTACLVGLAFLARGMMLRLIRLKRRALSMEQAKARAAANAAAASAAGDSAVAPIVATEPQADLHTHSQQTRRLVSSGVLAAAALGLWLIWVPVLPALSMLDNYPLWTNSTVVAAPVAASPQLAPGGIPSDAPTETPVQQVTRTSVTTLSDLAAAMLIVFLTFVLVRNGPGLLEMAVLQQLPLDASVRYAITTLVSYSIVLVGVIASCSKIGLEWSQVQWLATALTFGLAFGLQEMFANFVAGLIILLERPIRVGDVVTVDNIDGVVSKIRIRATSITNWDRKEYVVPNKEFITGRLLNWTLSDQVNRIVVKVGIAYGADTERAREILLKVANNHPLILKDPPSLATFEGFGDSALDLVLRTYLPNLDNRLQVIHELHSEINKAFIAEGIEIAFPQHDLHIRSAPAGLAMALRPNAKQAEEKRSAA